MTYRVVKRVRGIWRGKEYVQFFEGGHACENLPRGGDDLHNAGRCEAAVESGKDDWGGGAVVPG